MTRPVILGMNVSIDGYVAGPGGEGDVEDILSTVDDEVTANIVETLSAIDTMLMGRVNYLEQAEFWPTADDPIADLVNAQEKIVFSSTLEKVD